MIVCLGVIGLMILGWAIYYSIDSTFNSPRPRVYPDRKAEHDDLLRQLTPSESIVISRVSEATEQQATLPDGRKMTIRQIRHWS